MGRVILTELLADVTSRRPVVQATVVETSRSVPRRPGAKMLVRPDGTTTGTVGGGELESRVIAAALDSLSDGRPRLLSYSLVDPDGGDPGVCGGDVRVYLEPHMPQPTLYVVGCGHIGRAVVDLAASLDFRVVATDDRPDEVAHVDGAITVTGPIDCALEREPVDADTYVVVLTRNARLDAAILPSLLAAGPRYIGVMGSARRWELTRRALLDAGVDPAAVDAVDNPIGVEIGAETPAEIAVSILAEVVRRRRG